MARMDRADGHRYFEGLAVAHVLGGLDDSEGRVFRAHLLECPDCRARVGELRAIAHDLADVERDEHRVRAAQVIETKRRESDDADDELEEAPAPTRASRFTVLGGLLLLVGLSLWNFTLHGEMTQLEADNRNLVDAGVLRETGTEWRSAISDGDVQGVVKEDGEDFVVAVNGLDPAQRYGLYVRDESGSTAHRFYFGPSEEGRLYRLFPLPENASRLLISDPEDTGDTPAVPGSEPSGDTVFEARRP